MDKYQRAMLAIVIIIVVSSIAYSGYVIFGDVDTYFPFFIFFPSSLVIWIPIIARKREEELMKQEKLTKKIKEWNNIMLFKKDKEFMLAIGMVALIIAISLDIFAGQEPIVDFFRGLFTGLSITMNLSFLIRYRYKIKNEI